MVAQVLRAYTLRTASIMPGADGVIVYAIRRWIFQKEAIPIRCFLRSLGWQPSLQPAFHGDVDGSSALLGSTHKTSPAVPIMQASLLNMHYLVYRDKQGWLSVLVHSF
jgi:hypothetical protein